MADKAVVWVAPCPKRFILKGPLCIESSCLRFGTGPGSGEPKWLISKGRASTELHLWTFVRVRALSGGPKRLIFKGRASAESSALVLVTACQVMSHHVISCLVMSRHVTSRRVTSSLVMSRHVVSHVASCHVLSHHDMSCHVMSCHVMSCHVM